MESLRIILGVATFCACSFSALAEDKPAEAASPSPSISPASAEVQAAEALPESSPAADSEEPVAHGPEPGASPAAVDPAMSDQSFTEPSSFSGEAAAAERPNVPSTPENLAEKDRKEKLKYRQLKTQFQKDPQVAELWEKAETAKTMEDKRAALRAYYTLLYDKIAKADPSMEGFARSMEAAHINRLVQNRVTPTIPLHPPPSPQPAATVP